MTNYRVTSRNTDGTHLIGRYTTYEAAKKKADEWLGDKFGGWLNPYRAIDMFGGVLDIWPWEGAPVEPDPAPETDEDWDWESERRAEERNERYFEEGPNPGMHPPVDDEHSYYYP